MSRMAWLVLVSLTLCAGACVGPGGEAAGDAIGCGPECEADGKKAIFYVPRYYTTKWRVDADWADENMAPTAEKLREAGWEVQVVKPASLDAVAADLDARAANGERYDLFVTVGHSDPRGPYFGNPEGTGFREDLQAGWDWYGPGTLLEDREVKGIARLDALQELTDRITAILEPHAFITFVGCRTAQNDPSNDRNHTPFEREPGVRYETYVHAVAELTGHCVVGNQSRRSHSYTQQTIWELLYGGPEGKGRVPFEYREVCPATAPDDAIAGAPVADSGWAMLADGSRSTGVACTDPATCEVPEDEASPDDHEDEPSGG